ncbi:MULTISPECIES: NADP-dependent oxidoreductase [Croceibacter]|uniref:NADP-dependent oxidoreductase n=1 Tax=Croceibacter TaxID=216431 RepID=UPI000C4BD2C8|nr:MULTISPECIES: NADP-dependent oxidoreductase [Croceibacter]MBG26299.1 NADP-dependent oxidoreductase [Croceibacter sp.]|tara:strand:+ start:21143 stop:22138 length:996 start_codon:yes stop_codon:yes gene_type:complete
MNSTILLNNRPEGRPQESDFKFEESEKPSAKDGEILLETKYVSVDPYLRGRMRDQKSYIEPFELNEPITSHIIAEVIETKNDNFKEGDLVTGMLAWKKYQTTYGEQLNKIDTDLAPATAYLGILGMTGLTAYFGLTKIGEPKDGETLVVSGAAGAVGTVVGQIGKIKGCKVIGTAGTDDKVELLKDKFGYDEAINYKTTDNMKETIASAAPNGVDVYFDNVGGDITDAVLANIARNARVINCGAISVYNDTETPTGPRVEPILIKNSVSMQGFTIGNYQSQFKEGMQQLGKWLKEDKLTYSETIVEGFDNIPQAFIDLFDGKNQGKMIVKV